MEHLQYVIEDSTIAYLLGVNNFTNDESAILELVKNSYDAKALYVNIAFSGDQLIVSDNGQGMDENDIRRAWMHVGKSNKDYEIFDANNHQRILAGSKGVGRFALARLGSHVTVCTKKDSCVGMVWETDWISSTIREDLTKSSAGTIVTITGLREKWGKKKIENLVSFLSKTYNDKAMTISVVHPDFSGEISPYFPEPILGVNCLSSISINYNSREEKLHTVIDSDEFLDSARDYCPNIDLQRKETEVDVIAELSAYCGASVRVIPKFMFEIDHFVPQSSTCFASKADAGEISNIVLSCRTCNHNKSDFSMSLAIQPLLHPDYDGIKSAFFRDEMYYIRVSDGQPNEVTKFYKRLGLDRPSCRLDYLLLNMKGLYEKIADRPDIHNLLGQAIMLLSERRNGLC